MPAVLPPVSPAPTAAAGPTTARGGLALRLKLLRARVQEYLAFDCQPFRAAAGAAGLLATRLLWAAGQTRRAFQLLCKLHRADFLGAANARAERLAREAAAAAAAAGDHPVLRLYDDHVSQVRPTDRTAKFFKTPDRLLGTLALVLRSPRDGEKGVLLLQYSYTFPLFAKLFDLPRVAERYHLVLEPDWSGYCDPNVLCYGRYPFPVFVQAFEPRDAAFVAGLNSNLVPVPVSANWWIDHRLFHPLPGVEKDVDVVMIAGWGTYKRHAAFFAALGRLRRAGRRLRVLLLGYPLDSTLADLYRLAGHYGVADQVEAHEWVPYERVNALVNRARVCILWSRREGVNRAIIEAMFAGVPCLVRDGFNYGYHYPYVNDTTGCFATERGLPDKLLWMVEHHDRFAPREWVTAHMTCQRAAEILSDAIGKAAAARGEPWSGGVAAKVNKLHGVEYWDPADARRFEPDYAFLRSAVRGVPGSV